MSKKGSFSETLASVAKVAQMMPSLEKAPMVQSFTSLKDYKLADTMYERLAQQISDFQDELDDEHEVGALLASFGSTILIHIKNIGYHNPHLMILYGEDDKGREVRLLQHLSQTNILLVAVKPVKGPPKRIGFIQDE